MSDIIAPHEDRKRKVAVAGGFIGAVLASSCCVGPLLLITLGASGAWIGSLAALKVYQPVFVSLALGFLGYGFWQVYGKAHRACEARASCSTPRSDKIVKGVLWTATLLIAIALTTDLWAPLFY